MNCSEWRRAACAYLGCRGEPSADLLARVDACLDEAYSLAHFAYIGKTYTALPAWLHKQPYLGFLAGCTGCVLEAMTLGSEVERRVRALMTTDPARAVVLDACASALVELLGDDRERELFGEERTPRFCPGYGGSDVADNAWLFRELSPERIGMQLLPSGMMAPQKSMAGIVGLGKRGQRACGACMLRPTCNFLKEGTRCFRSENNF